MNMDDEKMKWPALALVIALAAIPLNAVAMVVLWRWFMVPLGMRAIGIWHMVGIRTLAGMFIPSDYAEKERKPWAKVLIVAMIPIFALLIGWLCKSNM